MLGKIKHEKVKPTKKNLNKILKELTIQYPFLKNSESSSRQQVFFIDLIQAYNKHKKRRRGISKIQIPEKNQNISFRIQTNNNNIRLNNRKKQNTSTHNR